MTKKNIDILELFLTSLGAIAAAVAAYTQIDMVLAPEASEKLRAVTGVAALAVVATLASIPVGIRSSAGGFILRFAAVFMIGVFAGVVSGIGRYLALFAIIVLFLALSLLLMRYLEEAENRGTSRL